MSRNFPCLIVLLLISMITISYIGNMRPTSAQLPPGIPRGDLVIVTQREAGRVQNPEWGNIWIPGAHVGILIVFEPMYYYNVSEPRIERRLIPCLAAAPPEYMDNYTKVRIRLKEGIYWSDGVEFTAEDVVFTIKLINNTEGFSQTSFWRRWLKDVYTEDKYTFVIELKSPNPRFHMFVFTQIMAAGPMHIMPKHIWEKVEDPLKFAFFPPVGTGPYKLKDYDPNGYWFLFERRDDWYRTGIGKTFGKPKPKYVLRIYYGGPEKELLAFTKHELDIADVSTELVDTALKQNPYGSGYMRSFPNVRLGTGGHGPVYNCGKYPYNITDVRWALTLAINVTELDITLFSGRSMICSFDALSNPYVRHIFEPLYLPWLRNFTLPDGYKPFDETIPYKLAKWAKSQGYEVAGDPVKVFGPGWWRYDPEEAAKLLEKHGFYRDEQGKWHLPDGTPWKIVVVGSSTHPVISKVIYGVAEQWRKFGIDVEAEAIPTGQAVKRYQVGDYDVYVACPAACQTIDIWRHYQSHHKMYYKPIGEIATGCQSRWVNDEFSEIMDKLALMPPGTPESIKLGVEAIKILLKEMPFASYYIGSKAIVVDNYVWTNWPIRDVKWYWDLQYWAPVWWQVILVYLRPTGNVPSSELTVEYTDVWITANVSRFVGVDGKTYGPYKRGDYVTLPKDDAERLIAEGLASRTPIYPGIEAITEKVTQITDKLTTIEKTISELKQAVQTAKAQAPGTEITVIALQILNLILLIIAVILMIRRKS
mgnify:CR=1 FL=1